MGLRGLNRLLCDRKILKTNLEQLIKFVQEKEKCIIQIFRSTSTLNYLFETDILLFIIAVYITKKYCPYALKNSLSS